MLIDSRSILGNGPAFPFNRSSSGGVKYQNDIDRINQSLYLIFSTEKGSRLNLPTFGSDLEKCKFEPLDDVLLERIKHIIIEDIRTWEPRISLIGIQFFSDSRAIDNSTLYISIEYQIINTNVTANYVYPFNIGTYDTEGISGARGE